MIGQWTFHVDELSHVFQPSLKRPWVVSVCFTEGLKALRSPGVSLSSSHVRGRLMALAVPLTWRSACTDLPCEHLSSFHMVLAALQWEWATGWLCYAPFPGAELAWSQNFKNLFLWHLRFMASLSRTEDLCKIMESQNHRTSWVGRNLKGPMPLMWAGFPCQIRVSR